jgi:DNA invertase Pin-like site-specific DNA recombinase
MIYKYIRYSTNSQDEMQQEHTIDIWLLQRGMKADAVIKDEGISGGVSYKNRNLFRLVQTLEMNDTLIVSEISRLTRSGFGELDELIRGYFKPNHLRLVICNVGLDINCSQIDAMTELQLSMLSIFAKMEKELIVGRTKSALDARRILRDENGGWISKKGNWTTGFGRKKGSIGKPISELSNAAWREKIGHDEDRHKQWKLIHEMRSRGDTLARIAETMNAVGEKTPNGKKWSAGQISRAIDEWGKYFDNSKE